MTAPDATPVVGQVLKADDEKRHLLTVAYAVNRVDPSVGMDGCRDFATPDVVEKAAHSWLKKGAKVGMWHRPGGENAAVVIESYTWPADEPWVIRAVDGTEQVIVKGDWLVKLECSESVWGLYKADKVGGVSIQGTAKRRRPDPVTLAQAMRSRSVGN